ncbi:MAG: hypothetical protein PHT88_02195 [Candidatus Moranbacteria bacterium]|nr:hypothetical protein [Candidatus Moranbacteria bacterium]
MTIETQPLQVSVVQVDQMQASTGILDDPEISRLYTPIEVAKEEIWRRWNDKELRAKVEAFLGGDIPDCLKNSPRVVLARNIASPNKESVHFLRVAQQVDLQPLFGEYLNDKFVALNPDKYYLGKLFFDNKDNGVKIVNEIDGGDGHSIQSMQTKWGESFIEFHHRMLQEITPIEDNVCDFSDWLSKHGRTAKKYYIQYLALFLCYGVLADVFLMYNKKERGFVDSIIIPAMDQLETLFGVRPLIIPLFHSKNVNVMDDAGEEWMRYPESMKQLIPNEFIR